MAGIAMAIHSSCREKNREPLASSSPRAIPLSPANMSSPAHSRTIHGQI
jgi:hypothetical protein